MSDTPELIPCPFCGNTNISIESAWAISESTNAGSAALCPLHNGGCGATGRYSIDPLVAAQSWNTRAAPEWISVEDRLPDIGKYLVYINPKFSHSFQAVATCFNDQFEVDGYSDSNAADFITHWAPLLDKP